MLCPLPSGIVFWSGKLSSRQSNSQQAWNQAKSVEVVALEKPVPLQYFGELGPQNHSKRLLAGKQLFTHAHYCSTLLVEAMQCERGFTASVGIVRPMTWLRLHYAVRQFHKQIWRENEIHWFKTMVFLMNNFTESWRAFAYCCRYAIHKHIIAQHKLAVFFVIVTMT